MKNEVYKLQNQDLLLVKNLNKKLHIFVQMINWCKSDIKLLKHKQISTQQYLINLMDDSPDNTNRFVEYRNALYQGGFVKGRREGKGILITDLGQIFIGLWKNDFLDDKALIWMDEKTYVIGDFNKGQMDGNFIYRDNKTLFYTTFSYDRITGKQLYIDRNEQRAILTEYKNSTYEEIENNNITGIGEGQIFEQMYGHPVQLPTLERFKKQVMFKDGMFEEKNLNTGNKFVWFNKCNTVEKLGFVMLKDELVSFGVYKEDVLEGLGYQFTNKTRYQGVFKNGLLNGLGLKHQILKHNTVIGNFVEGDMVDLQYIDDNNNKGEDLTEFKRSIHLRSMYFFNSFVQSSSLLKHSGFSDIINKYHPQQQYLYQESPTKSPRKKQQQQQQQQQQQLTSKLSHKSSLKRSEIEIDVPVTSPLKKTTSKRIVEDDPELKGANLLLGRLERGNYEGSLKGNLEAYEEMESLRKKNKRQF